ncbi:hypothetical protein GYMLUDRAFT_988466, partial [Collybiopsis luxurians FD-317 M1]
HHRSQHPYTQSRGLTRHQSILPSTSCQPYLITQPSDHFGSTAISVDPDRVVAMIEGQKRDNKAPIRWRMMRVGRLRGIS